MGDSGVVPATAFSPQSTKQQMEFLVEEWCCMPPTKFQTLIESIPRCIEAVLARGGPITYEDTLCWCFLSFGSYMYDIGDDSDLCPLDLQLV
jgi:hypothetical protein